MVRVRDPGVFSSGAWGETREELRGRGEWVEAEGEEKDDASRVALAQVTPSHVRCHGDLTTTLLTKAHIVIPESQLSVQ